MSLTEHAGKMIFKKNMHVKQFILNLLKSYMERNKCDASHVVEDTMDYIMEAYKIAQCLKSIEITQVVLCWFPEFCDNGHQFLVHSIMNELSLK